MARYSTRTEIHCHHCGDPCQQEIILFDRYKFCCEGCRTVYQLLQDTGLGTYYDLAERPGTKSTDSTDKEMAGQMDVDDPEIQARLLDFAEDNLHIVTLKVPAIHCSACIWLLEKLPEIAPGISQSKVNFNRKEITVSYVPQQQKLSGVVHWLTKIGYKPQLEGKDNKKPRTRSLLTLKLGIAGFCFGNIMLFSFPEYLGMDDESLRQFAPIFGYLNMLLALPVFFYSGWDYFRTALKSLKLKYISIDVPIAIGLLVLFVRSGFEVISGTGTGYFDSLAGLVFFMLGGKWFQAYTYDALNFERDYKSYFPMTVSRIEKGQQKSVLIGSLAVGDRIRILNNQVIPADSVLQKGGSLIDYSFVNGEVEPVRKVVGDTIFAGGRHNGAPIELETLKPVNQGYLTRLWNQSAFTGSEDKPQFSDLLNTISKYFTLSILLIATVSFAYWSRVDISVAWNAFTAVLIIACPCALALSMPFTFGNVTRLLGRSGFYVRNSAVLEKLATADTLVFDKTGTLTTPRRDIIYYGTPLSPEAQKFVKSTAMCSTHPLSVALAGHIPGPVTDPDSVTEFEGKGIQATFSGAFVAIGSANFISVHDFAPHEFGESHVFVKVNGQQGCFVFRGSFRPGMEEMISGLRNDGFEMHVVSGDNKSSRKTIEKLFGPGAPLNFHQSPEDKLNYIEGLKEQGKKVAFIGDGLNDAGALKAAEIGIAVADDVHGFSPSSDIIASSSALAGLRKIIRFARQSLTIVKLAIIFSLFYNVLGLFLAVQGLLTPVFAAIFMPLSSISVVTFVTLSTRWLYGNVRG